MESYQSSYKSTLLGIAIALLGFIVLSLYGKMNINLMLTLLLIYIIIFYKVAINRSSSLYLHKNKVVVENKLRFWADDEELFYQDIDKLSVCFGSRKEPYVYFVLFNGKKKKSAFLESKTKSLKRWFYHFRNMVLLLGFLNN